MKKQVLFILLFFCFGSAFSQNPTNLQVSNVNPTDVTLTWDDGGCTSGSYILRYRESGAAWNQNSPITIGNTGGSQTHLLSGLTASITYNWRIKCGSGGSWVNGPSFTTTSCNVTSSISTTNAINDFGIVVFLPRSL